MSGNQHLADNANVGVPVAQGLENGARVAGPELDPHVRMAAAETGENIRDVTRRIGVDAKVPGHRGGALHEENVDLEMPPGEDLEPTSVSRTRLRGRCKSRGPWACSRRRTCSQTTIRTMRALGLSAAAMPPHLAGGHAQIAENSGHNSPMQDRTPRSSVSLPSPLPAPCLPLVPLRPSCCFQRRVRSLDTCDRLRILCPSCLGKSNSPRPPMLTQCARIASRSKRAVSAV